MNTVSKKSYGKLYIEKKSAQEWMVFLIIILPFIFAPLTEVFGLPGFISFSLDLLLVCLCGIMLAGRYFSVKKNIRPLVILVSAFFVYTFIVYGFNFQSPFYYLWGLRNNFRFYIAFFVFTVYIREEAAISFLKLFDILFWVNFAASLIQFFFLGVNQDNLGGIFGVGGGTNGYTLLFFCIVISKSLLDTFNGQGKAYSCILKIVASIVIAAMAEMKFYYIAFILILIITAFLTRFSKKKLVLILLSIVGVFAGVALLSFLFDEFESFVSLDSILEIATKENYSSQKDVNRLSAIFTLAKDYVTTLPERLFGMGLGNCDTSELSIFNSHFYQTHSYLHYTWFSSAMLFLETGLIGIALYISFFVICILFARKKLREQAGNKLFCQLAIVIAVMCCVIMVYNSSLRIEAGYMAYLVLALPFIADTASQRTK